MAEGLESIQIGEDGAFEVDFDFDETAQEEIVEEQPQEEDTSLVEDELKEDEFIYDDEEDASIDEDADDSVEDDNEPSEDSEDINPLQAFTQSLAEKGMVLDLEEGQEISSDEELFEHFQKSIDSVVANSIEEADKLSHGAVSHFLNGGSPDEFIKVFGDGSNEAPTYAEADIADNDKAKKEIAEAYFKSKGFSGKKLTKYTDNSVDLDEDSEFLEMQSELQEADTKKKSAFQEQAKAKEAEKNRQIEEYRNKVHDTIVNTTEFIPGRKLDKKTREKVYENAQGTLTKINKDLSKYVPTLALLDHYGLLDGKFDKVMKEVETKQTKGLAQILKSTKRSKKNSKPSDSADSSIREAALYSIRKNK